MEYPYQIVAFLDAQPEKGKLIYGDESGGWLAQVALKRRFALRGVDESEFVRQLRDYYNSVSSFEIKTGNTEKPANMPVEVIPVVKPGPAASFHQDFLAHFGKNIVSKFPKREGDNYFPHITAQFWGKYVIDVVNYENKAFSINSVWLVKDAADEKNTAAFEQFLLKSV